MATDRTDATVQAARCDRRRGPGRGARAWAQSAAIATAVVSVLLALSIPLAACAPSERSSALRPSAADEPGLSGGVGVGREGPVVQEIAIRVDGAPGGAANAAGEAAGPAAPPDAAGPLAARLGSALADDPDRYGVVVEHVRTGLRFVHQPRRPFPAGSVYKLALAHEVLREAEAGRLALDERLTIEDADATEPEPDGGVAIGEEVAVRGALRAMMAVSSNAAAEVLLRRLGPDRFSESLRALGLADTRVPAGAGAHAVTTAADMAGLLGRVARDATLGADARRELRELLALCEEPDGLVDGVPPGVEVLSKAGNLARSSSVIGVLATGDGPVVISVLDDDVDPGDARATIRAIARATLDAYGAPTGIAGPPHQNPSTGRAEAAR